MLIRYDLHSVSDIAQYCSKTNIIAERHIYSLKLTIFKRLLCEDVVVYVCTAIALCYRKMINIM